MFTQDRPLAATTIEKAGSTPVSQEAPWAPARACQWTRGAATYAEGRGAPRA